MNIERYKEDNGQEHLPSQSSATDQQVQYTNYHTPTTIRHSTIKQQTGQVRRLSGYTSRTSNTPTATIKQNRFGGSRDIPPERAITPTAQSNSKDVWTKLT